MKSLIEKLAGMQPSGVPLPNISPDRIDAAIDQLSALQREIICRRCGRGRPAETLTAIGNDMQRSYEQIRRIETRALRKLRYHLRDLLRRQEEV